MAAILEACGAQLPEPASVLLPFPISFSSPSPAPTDTLPAATDAPPAATQPLPTPTSTPVIPPDLVVTRSGEPEELVRRAIAALGGMQKFVSSGANVVVKPNICVAYRTYEYAATTNPWVVEHW